jgi:fluoride exporter
MIFKRRQVETFLIIGLGAVIGANFRYWLSGWAAQQFGQTFPWGTLIVNFTGSALLGVFNGWLSSRIGIDPRLRLLVAIGFFGAYTTFSTYSNESVALYRAGDWLGLLGYVLGTNLSCLIGAFVGLMLGSRL